MQRFFYSYFISHTTTHVIEFSRLKLSFMISHKTNIFSVKTPNINFRKQPSGSVLKKRCSENKQQIYRRTPMPKCDFNKVALQLYWNRTSAWVFSCKFAAYFQNTFSSERLWTTASVILSDILWHMKFNFSDWLSFMAPR